MFKRLRLRCLVMAKLAAYYQGNDNRKVSGGFRARPYKVKRKALGGGPPTNTRLGGVDRRLIERVTGGGFKIRLAEVSYANVYDKGSGTCRKAKILRIVESPANSDFAKRGIIVKGTIIETEVGRAVVTSRPGQDGVVNAVKI
jgi:small subunit ribosomal protein S8e